MENKALKAIIALAIGGVAVWMFLKVKEAQAAPTVPGIYTPIIPTPEPKTSISFDFSTGKATYSRNGESYSLTLFGQRKEEVTAQPTWVTEAIEKAALPSYIPEYLKV